MSEEEKEEDNLPQSRAESQLLLDVRLNHCGLFIQFNLSTHARQSPPLATPPCQLVSTL